jgi:ribonuclease HI
LAPEKASTTTAQEDQEHEGSGPATGVRTI